MHICIYRSEDINKGTLKKRKEIFFQIFSFRIPNSEFQILEFRIKSSEIKLRWKIDRFSVSIKSFGN